MEKYNSKKVPFLEGKNNWVTKTFGKEGSVVMTDGPHGIRKQLDLKDAIGLFGSIEATAFPTASLTACSFDRDLIALMAKHIAIEAKANKVNIVLGPGVNIKRTPLCGRNFEYISEDPYLSGELGAAYVKAVEAMGIGTAVKHFVCNNQEKNRFVTDSIVDERALREIYLKSFEPIIKNKPGLVMASYNKINGHYGCESPMLKTVLRKEWGFKGVIVSDWGAINNRVNSIKKTCDLEMPSSKGYHTQKVLHAYKNDINLQKSVEDSFSRVQMMINKYQNDTNQTFNKENHHQIARKIASESMVLLKNENILPLNPTERIAIVGGFVNQMRYQGGGSSHINPTHLDQIQNIYKDYSKNIEIGKGYGIKEFANDEMYLLEAIKLAQEAEKVVIIVGLTDADETEGFDRRTLDIPGNQQKLIKEIAKVTKNIIIVAIAGSVINLDFENKTKAILMAYLGGQATSLAIMDILYGSVNPSARLAETFIDKISDCNVELNDNNSAVYYNESIFVGYRYYQTFQKQVRYPFGHGLSYTKFSYSQFTLLKEDEQFIISLNIKNIGKYDGKEVVQIYIENNKSTAYKTQRELKQFTKIELKVKEDKTIQLKIPKSAFEFYDVFKKRFIVEQGVYKIIIASNVQDAIHCFEVELKGEKVNHQQLSYNDKTYNTSSFETIYGRKLPPPNIRKKRPYTLSATVIDLRNTLVGKIIAAGIVKQGLKMSSQMKEEWMIQAVKQTLIETPIRMLAIFGGEKFNLHKAEGLIDIANLHFIKGIKKLIAKTNGGLK